MSLDKNLISLAQAVIAGARVKTIMVEGKHSHECYKVVLEDDGCFISYGFYDTTTLERIILK